VATRPVPSTPTADIFNALRPTADVEIVFEGGIRLDYSNWLEDHPPAIRIYGDAAIIGTPVIDAIPGVVEELSAGSRWIAPGWDAVGAHQVWCGGVTRTYSIVTRAADPDFWPAYRFG